MDISELIQFYSLQVAVVAALFAFFGQRFWIRRDRSNKIKRIQTIMHKNLTHLRSDLLRIRDKRNSPSGDPKQRIEFNKTSFSEVSGYAYLYTEFFLQHINDIDLTKYPNTIEFFLHYRINIETIKSRFDKSNDSVKNGYLQYNSVNLLLERLDKAIAEFS